MTVISDNSLLHAFAPTGKLRTTINLGNPILANQAGAMERPYGVSVDLATELARRLGVDIELVIFDAAGKAVDALKNDQADIGFFAIDPLRGEGIHFTPPYVVIEGSYMVPLDSAIRNNAEVDQAHHRVAVGAGSAYDLYLSRHLRQAQIVRAPTSPAVVDLFLAQKLDVAAGVRQQLEADARRVPDMRLLDGRFMAIHQAMGIPKNRGQAAFDYLNDFVEEMKARNFIAQALVRHHIGGATVAPPGYPKDCGLS